MVSTDGPAVHRTFVICLTLYILKALGSFSRTNSPRELALGIKLQEPSQTWLLEHREHSFWYQR